MTQPVTVEISIEDERWEALNLSNLANDILEAGFRLLDLPFPVEVSLLAANDARIAELNGTFRGKETPTNVLSWPSEELSIGQGKTPKAPQDPEIGDIALSYETCAQEAKNYDKMMENHVMHLVLHGFLHLLGYDHDTDDDAKLMEELEVKALETLGIENPY